MRNLLKVAIILACAGAVVGCSSSSSLTRGNGQIDSGLNPEARLVTLNGDGSIPDQNFARTGTSGRYSNLTQSNGRLTGFAYQYGRVEGTNRFLGVAGIAPTTNPGPPPTKATATYSGEYNLTYANRNQIERRTGTIRLAADFDEGELAGRAGRLRVDGTITGQVVDGTVTYRNVEADMSGLIGSERVVAAFAGDEEDALLVGGLIAEADD